MWKWISLWFSLFFTSCLPPFALCAWLLVKILVPWPGSPNHQEIPIHCCLISISVVVNDVEPLYLCLLTIWEDPDAAGQEEKGMTEDEMVGWHHRLSGHGFGRLRQLVMDREAWRAAVHGVAKSQTRLSNWTDWQTWPFVYLWILLKSFTQFSTKMSFYC